MFDKLITRVQSREARVAVVGLGYVGLPLILRLSEAGFPVTGFDVNRDHLARLGRGESPFTHIPNSAIAPLAANDTRLTDDFSAASEVDAVLICLPTPLDRHRQPDLSYVTDSMKALAPHLHPDMMVSLESTTWPGTTEEVLAPIIEAQGLTVGRDVALLYSPEREDPGNRTFTIRQIPKVVGGITPECQRVGEALYGAIVDHIVPVSSTRAAELTKLLENIQRSVNIGLMNEMKMISEPLGVDIFEVIDAAATKPFGFTRYTPGPGLGGHCIPIDPFYLTWKAREYGIHTRFIELAGEINSQMPDHVVRELVRRLSSVLGKALHGARVLVVGLAYKPDVNDIRESPALRIIELLSAAGARVSYHDPYCREIPSTREFGHLKGMASVSPDSESWNAAVIVTNHSSIDYEKLLQQTDLIVDTRNAYSAEIRAATGKVFQA